MNFEWDEQKNRTNIRKHGFDFTDAHEMFDLPMTRVSLTENRGSLALAF